MKYISTRANHQPVSGAQAIQLGMVPGGGLFVPQDIPQVGWKGLQELNYVEICARLLKVFLPDYDPKTLDTIAAASYAGNFDRVDVAPLVALNDKLSVLELWHGPTAAFKDMAVFDGRVTVPPSIKNSPQAMIARFSG